ncbi:X-Pro dipeptidyl-peptidase (S15 family)/X-Pro dipeptidyl-peptidase C-terminal non-catalytic domain protein [Mycolicibacterium chubuense NBB4]|uniref:X-Pro dipeptidyl-peptidase (S15 family)/X-Pro dipeptidyl-peptidase C-terminal non-catalytic domain protein n=1 Tax=Mycolicibacterium chubuense (strain NBB4) TaxID=710421 RepID=I4BE89_MYCCN|nr:X-Pro dipeptidyl-peptidase (S15 family)/X-Pro dipeptidyl-peptidase C-terminal non-catalytic domain protein [Mycolicibacterium chubuense NBB4]
MGRVGGLAVALGIGAAIWTGAGVALADDGASGSPSSASQASAKTSQTSPAASAKADRPAKAATSARRDRSARRDTSREADTTAAAADDAPPVPAKRWADRHRVESRDSAGEHVTRAGDVEPETAEGAAPKPSEPQKPDVVATRISNVVHADFGVHRGDAPATPAKSALALTMLATAREKADEATVDTVKPQVATSLAADPYPIPTDVKVVEVRPPLEWLQEVPVMGRFVVTPIVQVIHAVPFVSDIVHPLIGFPIDHDAPPGTPRARTVKVVSFDGTEIYVNFMPAKGLQAGQSAPTVLSGPGVGLPGSTTLNRKFDEFLPHDMVGIGMLRDAGYNVVTWDPRGEWHSGGRMELQSPDFEGRDISSIISWLSTLDSVQSVDGDPKIGMVGLSYGGGIQLSAATVDHRIDAIVPTMAWNSLVDGIFPRQAVSSVWGTFLSGLLVLTGARPNERVLPAVIGAVLTGTAKQSDIDLFNSLNYADRLANITAPTLLVQGTVDTLLTLAQADKNAKALIDAGTTTKVVWYCGGHGACLSSVNDGTVVWRDTMGWLDRYVKGDESIDTGPQFEWVDQHGDWFSSDTYPAPAGVPVTATLATGGKTLPFIPFIGGSGPNPRILTRGLIPAVMGLPSGAPALNAVNLHVPDATETTHLLGAPELTLTYSGRGNAEHVYAQLVDDETHLVLGNQVTPIPVVLDGQSHTVTFSMEQIAHTLQPGESVTLQLVTSAFPFLNFYSHGRITVEGMSVKLPTMAAAQVLTVAA